MMFRSKVRQWCGCVLAVLACQLAISADNKITWLEMDAPPYHIQQGEAKNQGVVDRITRLLQRHLTEYQHFEKLMNLPRAAAVMGEGEKVCHASLYKTPEREAVAYFSKVPSTIFPPVGLTVRREDYQKFGGNTYVSFKQVLSSTEFHGGLSRGRSYGEVLDQMIAEQGFTSRLDRRSGDDIYRGLFRMLLYGRIDYILGSPMEAAYVGRSLGVPNGVRNLMILEHSNYDFGFIACAKSEWGAQVIAEIDELLLTLRPTKEYQGFFVEWLDELTAMSFEKAYQEQFLTYGQ